MKIMKIMKIFWGFFFEKSMAESRRIHGVCSVVAGHSKKFKKE